MRPQRLFVCQGHPASGNAPADPQSDHRKGPKAAELNPLVRCSALILSAAAACLDAGAARATEAEGATGIWYARVDNDLFTVPKSDTNYTMGLATSYVVYGSAGPNWFKCDPLFPVLSLIDDRAHWGIGEKDSIDSRRFLAQDDAFTPACLRTSSECKSNAIGQPIDQDRPYANILWTGVGVSWLRDDTSEAGNPDHDRPSEAGNRVFWITHSSEFDVGVLGTDIGKFVQTSIHRYDGGDNLPREWDTQIGNGGSPTFLYKRSVEYTWALCEGPCPRGLAQKKSLPYFAVKPGLWVGWNTWPTVEVVAKYGDLRVSGVASYVLYDELLQGAWSGSSKIKYSYSQIEHVVNLMHFDWDLSGTVRRLPGWNAARPCWGVTISQNWKSRDVKASGVENRHRWGGIELWWKD